jgi:hypothetical protein
MQSGLSTLRRIREALQATADALGSAHIEALAANDAVLAAAVAHLPDLRATAPLVEERPAYRDELQRTRVALLRCLQLGASLNEFARATLVAQGRAGAYGREGREKVDVRAGALHVRG